MAKKKRGHARVSRSVNRVHHNVERVIVRQKEVSVVDSVFLLAMAVI